MRTLYWDKFSQGKYEDIGRIFVFRRDLFSLRFNFADEI